MAINPSYPGVYIEELTSPVHPITGVATSIAAFVGYTASGIDGRAQTIYSFSDYQRLYGGLASNSEVSYAVQQFFNNGGNQAYVVRVPPDNSNPATVTFDTLVFTALSSGAWANAQLLIDVDFVGLALPLPGNVLSVVGTTVTGTSPSFTSSLKANQWLVFGSDASQTPYQIKSVNSGSGLTMLVAPTVPAGSTTAIAIVDITAFNLTITNLVDGAVETFPNVSLNNNLNNYVMNVVNDFDNGSQLVKVNVSGAPTRAPVTTGLVGTPVAFEALGAAMAGVTAEPGDVGLTFGSNMVSGTALNTDFQVGQLIYFSTDTSKTLYQISTIAAAGTSMTLTVPYSGPPSTPTTTATIVGTTTNAAYGLQLGVSGMTLPPLPIFIPVFPNGSPIPQSVAGLAALVMSAINTALAVQLPGARVLCSVSGAGANQAIRINASFPQVPDVVLTIIPFTPVGGLTDASGLLGLHPGATGGPTPYPPAANNVAHYALGTGNATTYQTSSSLGSDGSGLPWTVDLIGNQGNGTGIYALALSDIFFNLLCIPEATRAIPGNPAALDTTVDPNSVYSAAIALCDTKRAILLLDCPPNVNTVAAAVDWKTSGLTVVDANGAAFFPRLRLPDPLNEYQLRTFAPCGVVAGLYARIDSTRGVWKSPAGTEATLSGVQALVYKLSDLEQGSLNPLGLNCFRNFPVYGSVLWGARTLLGADAQASQWKYVAVRRVALFIESSLYQGTQWVVFEPNDEPLWSAIRLNVGAFMQDLFIQGYFQGQTPSQAYFVKCDDETTTQTDIDNGVVNIVVGFAPLLPAEFVVIQIQQLSGQTSN